jgi:hypothetical protein
MRKRNKPILLATLLVVFIGAAVAMNATMMPKSASDHEPHAETPAEDPKPLAESRKADNSGSAKNAAMALSKPTAISPRGRPGASGPPKMAIVKTPAKAFKPVPNDSMTSSQWYNDEYGYKGKDQK